MTSIKCIPNQLPSVTYVLSYRAHDTFFDVRNPTMDCNKGHWGTVHSGGKRQFPNNTKNAAMDWNQGHWRTVQSGGK